ncbi:MAG: hypothetical protein IPJ34_04625 [Myxococcales bacterium]|nr:hypothetical protein [Myxococcales bacterium]
MRHAFALLLSTSLLALAACSGSTATSPDPDASGDTSTDDALADSSPVDTGEGTDTGTPPDTAPDTVTPPADYTAKGTHPTKTVDVKISGTAVHVIFPTDPVPAAGFPAVVFAHGFQLGEKDYDDTLTHVASWGFVVVSTDYTASLVSNDHRKVKQAILDARAAAIAGTLAGVPKVDASKIAASGHSLGGKCATWASTEKGLFAGTFVLDPVDRGGPFDGTSTDARPFLIPTGALDGLSAPIGYVGATQSRCVKLTQTCAAEDRDAASFFKATKVANKYLWTMFDYGHMQFLDNPGCGFTCDACVPGTTDPPSRRKWVKALFVAFLSRHVLGDASAQPWLDGAKRDEGVAAKVLWDGKIARPACP